MKWKQFCIARTDLTDPPLRLSSPGRSCLAASAWGGPGCSRSGPPGPGRWWALDYRHSPRCSVAHTLDPASTTWSQSINKTKKDKRATFNQRRTLDSPCTSKYLGSSPWLSGGHSRLGSTFAGSCCSMNLKHLPVPVCEEKMCPSKTLRMSSSIILTENGFRMSDPKKSRWFINMEKKMFRFIFRHITPRVKETSLCKCAFSSSFD